MVCEREGKKAHEKMAEAQCHARVMSNHLKNEKPSQFKVKYREKKKSSSFYLRDCSWLCVLHSPLHASRFRAASGPKCLRHMENKEAQRMCSLSWLKYKLTTKKNKHDLGRYVDRSSLYYLQLHIVLHCLSFFFFSFLTLCVGHLPSFSTRATAFLPIPQSPSSKLAHVALRTQLDNWITERKKKTDGCTRSFSVDETKRHFNYIQKKTVGTVIPTCHVRKAHTRRPLPSQWKKKKLVNRWNKENWREKTPTYTRIQNNPEW